MHGAASKNDFYNILREDGQQKIERLLQYLKSERLSCRVEVAGRDLVVVVAPGLSAPSYWLTRFGLESQDENSAST